MCRGAVLLPQICFSDFVLTIDYSCANDFLCIPTIIVGFYKMKYSILDRLPSRCFDIIIKISLFHDDTTRT